MHFLKESRHFGTICLINIMHNIQYISKTIGLISKCKKVKIEIKGTRDRGEEKLNIRCDNTVKKIGI